MNKLSRREREKQVHEAEIVTAAEKIFGRKGFDEASMDEIAKEAQFTRRTVYQYFANKEDLYFAVIAKGFRELSTYFDAIITTGQTGFEKIQQAGLAYYKFHQDYPDIFRLMNYIGYIRKKTENSPQFETFIKINNQLFQELAQVIGEGQADGSIRKDLEAAKVGYSFIFVLTGFFYQLAAAGKNFTSHIGLDEESFVRSTLDLICQGFQA